MPQWVIPVTVEVWVEAGTLTKAKEELWHSPPFVDVIGSSASYVSAAMIKFGKAKVVTKRPIWADQR